MEKKTSEKIVKVKRGKPSLQIYRPPGLLRNVSSKNLLEKDSSVYMGQTSNANSDFRFSNENAIYLKNSSFKKPVLEQRNFLQQPKKHNRNSVECVENNATKPKEFLIRPQFLKETAIRKKIFSEKQFSEIVFSLNKLDITKEEQLIDQFVKENMINKELGDRLAQKLVHYAIEENKQSSRVVAHLCAQLIECPAGPGVKNGFIVSNRRYFECREKLRKEHLRVWINFLNFVSELYLNIAHFDEEKILGDLAEIIFNIFYYLLKNPILDTLKIEELECLISVLLSIGYDLERNCPEQLGFLKNWIRDAFITVKEPWARKMILLLIELGASGWNLSSDANEY